MKYIEVNGNGLVVRRRDKRVWYVLLGVFVAVFLFSFMVQRFKNDGEVTAASLVGFDPGYIISDYQMGNYTSMDEVQIQSFLTNKNSCSNRDYNLYLQLSANKNYTWHWKDGHFVCLSEELFGDGEVIGSGETAAHIIWQAAQDYRINPQVLLVLLQKETSLITDPIPNNGDYRKATGYGCPDTAPCSSQYYGFKNQIRKAAALFSTVLNGGWTNYPLGNNYVQYNPNAGCGGSVVNIRSLATSALYRYTPYQPNAGAIAAGYGTAYCGAYGNRNFYLYFEDWFGGITDGGGLSDVYKGMVAPRLLYVKKGAKYIDPVTGETKSRGFGSFEYFTHLNYQGEELCLSIGDKKNCYLYNDLAELNYSEPEDMAIVRVLIVKNGANVIDYDGNRFGEALSSGEKMVFSKKITINGELCLQTQDMVNECVSYNQLEEIPKVELKNMVVPRNLYVSKNARSINILTGIESKIDGDEKVFFNKLTYWFGELCLANNKTMNEECILYDDLKEVNMVSFGEMATPRFMKVKKGAIAYDVELSRKKDSYENDQIMFFDKKTNMNGGLCLGQSNSNDTCVKYKDLEEIDNFIGMDLPRVINVASGVYYYDLKTNKKSQKLAQNGANYFVDKIVVGGELCLRTEEDAKNKQYRCIKYEDLNE